MTTPIPVSLAGDGTSGPTFHGQVPPDFYDSLAPMDWKPGGVFNVHKIASSVFHKGQKIVLDGHDQGPLLPHSPTNHPLAFLKSARKVVYATAAVKANGGPMAVVSLPDAVCALVCGDPWSAPVGENHNNIVHSVYIGMSAMDQLRGEVRIACNFATETCSYALAIFGAHGSQPPSSMGDAMKDLGSDVLGLDHKKSMVGADASLVESLVMSAASGWQEPIGRKISIGSPYGSAELELFLDPSSGDAGVRAAGGLLGGALGGELRRSDGSWKTSGEGKLWGDAL